MPIPTNKLSQVAFSSQFRIEHVVSKTHTNYGTIGSDPYYNFATITIPHNLGYTPFFRLWIQLPGDGRLWSMATGPTTYGLVGSYQIDDIWADNSNIYVSLEVSDVSYTGGVIYYRIYAEKQA